MVGAGCFLLSWLALQAPCPGICPSTPLCDLASSYTHGELLSLELTPDASRGFTAEGAVITILDLLNAPVGGSAPVIQKIPVPDCQPLALAYVHQAGASVEDQLFMAGGSHGLWRLSLCSCLFGPTPSACTGVPPACPPYSLERITVIEGGYFERKRCVDVAILHGEESDFLFALFAASSDPLQSAIGPTELHAYALSAPTSGCPTGVCPIASMVFNATLPNGTPTFIGTALAVDPGDSDSIYVAMGKDGIYRVDLLLGAPASLSAVQLPINFCPSPPACTPAPQCLQNVRDISIVRAVISGQSRAFLYGALNYGAILEYELTASIPTSTIKCVTCGHPERIAAAVDGTNVLVAIATEKPSGMVTESSGPYWVNGVWSSICLKNHLDDPDDPGGFGDCREMQFYSRDLAFPNTITYRGMVPHSLETYGSLLLRRVAPNQFRSYACSTQEATRVHDIDISTGFAPQLLHTYVGQAFGAGKPTISKINPGIMRFGTEYAGLVKPEGGMVHIGTSGTYAISFITDTNLCNPMPPLPCTPICTLKPEAPYGGNILGEAHWIDPADPAREIFVNGGSTIVRIDLNASPTCDSDVSIDECSGDPCATSPVAFWTAGGLPGAPLFSPGPPPEYSKVGWKIGNLALPAAGTTTVPVMAAKWRQYTAPVVLNEVWTPSAVYATATIDPRPPFADGHPRVSYLLRSTSSHGVKVVRPVDLLADANNPCSILANRGFGESVVPLDPSQVWQLLTHVELEKDVSGNTQCEPCVTCNALIPNQARNLYNNTAEVFRTRDSTGAVAYVLAVVTGYPAAGPTFGNCAQVTGCPWVGYYGRPMLVLFDVTETGAPSFLRPKLLRVFVGDDEGHSFALAIKTYGTGPSATTYAFVGDILGKLLVFDVSSSKIFPAAPPGPYLPGNSVLRLDAMLDFPKDPYDGWRANVIDLAVDGNFLYCALGRGGMGIVDITNPLSPFLCAVLDTPGLVLGLGLRTVGTPTNPVKQLIVGDSRCGVRLYQ